MQMHDSVLRICSKSAFRELLRQTAMDPGKILQLYVGQTQISCVKILAPWAKGAQNGGEKGGSFCNEYNELAFFVVGQIGMKFGENVNHCPLLNLNWRVLKICP